MAFLWPPFMPSSREGKGTVRLGMVDGADTPPAFRRTKQPADVLRLPVNVLFGVFLFDLHLDDREQRLEKALQRLEKGRVLIFGVPVLFGHRDPAVAAVFQ